MVDEDDMEILESPRKKTIPLSELSSTEYKGYTFLYVDDNRDQQFIMKIFFERYGAVVDFAENGQVAWQMYEDMPDKYHIIFMDRKMPVMSGDEAVGRIRGSETRRAKTIPVVSLSGHVSFDQIEESVYTFSLYKPFQMEQLAYAINHILKEKE